MYTTHIKNNPFIIIKMMIILLIFATTARAQTIPLITEQGHLGKPPLLGRFTQIGLDEGLSQSTIYTIEQDAQGFMWFGTQEGLNKYDGYSITVFKHNPADSKSIADNSILSLLSDNRGDLWVGTIFGGLDRYVVAENRFYHHHHNYSDNTSVSDERINVLFEDTQHTIWVGTQSGLDLYNRKSNTFTHILFNRNGGSQLKAVNAICEDKENNLWIGTVEGLFKINLKDPSYKIQKTFPDEHITSLFIDGSDVLWIGTKDKEMQSFNKETGTYIIYPGTTRGTRPILRDTNLNFWLGSLYSSGLRVMDPKTHTVSSISNIPNDLVNALYEDNSGILWIGTYLHGVYTYDSRNNRFGYYLNDPQNPNLIMALYEDKSDCIWAGTLGNGLKYYNEQRDKVITFLNDPKNSASISSNKILSLAELPENNIWIGTLGDGLNCYDKKTGIFKHYTIDNPGAEGKLSGSDVTALFADSKRNLWIGYYSGQIDLYSVSDKKFSHLYSVSEDSNIPAATITIFREDSNGKIWIGTHGDGLLCYVPGENKFNRYQISEINHKPEAGLISEISTLYIESDTTLWLGSSRNGLIKYNPEKKKSIFFTTDNGLADNAIYGILADQSGCLWLSTNNGISRFDTKTGTFKNFDKNDGLQSNEFNQGAYFQNANGELFFGGVNGFNSFYPEKIKDNQSIPPVYFTSFKVFDKVISLPNSITFTKEITLSYFQNFFSFEFVALSYTAPDKNQYAYMLEGFDKNWHKVTANNRYASYTNLDPGEYVLHIKGSNNDGIWNEKGAAITIIITPPIWMTWWFRTIVIIAFISLGPIIYSRRVKTLKKEKSLQLEISKRLIEKQEEERSRIAQEMHDSIGQDMLFIKNRALLTMQNAASDSKICEQLNQISEASSKSLKTLREISHNLRPPELDRLGLTETLRTLLLQARESTSLKIEGEVEEIDGMISREMEINIVRIIQEALGNIIRHSKASECRILIRKNDGFINLEVSDNGKGFEIENITPKSVGLGLTGMKERVRILHGIFNINSEPGKGTRIRIEIPQRN